MLYGMTTFAFDLMYGFMKLTPMATGYYGFMAGSLSTGALGLLVGIGARNTAIDPLDINKWSIAVCNRSQTCTSVLGGQAKRKDDVFAVRQTMGHFAITSTGPTWKPASVQMVYDVEGPAGKQATVVAEAVRTGWLGKDQLKFVGMVGKGGATQTPILVKGDESAAGPGFALLKEMQSKVTFH